MWDSLPSLTRPDLKSPDEAPRSSPAGQAAAPADRPAFDVASVKTNKSGGGSINLGNLGQSGSLYRAMNVTLNILITAAYQLKPRTGSQPGMTASPSDTSGPPSLFTAVQEQLGLKLESQTGPVDVLVIDHVEEPAPN
jgi:Protein of unknown function (DUF3738)